MRCGNRKKFLCLDAHSQWLLEDCHWGARAVLDCRTIPGELVNLCAFELTQVKFLLLSSDGCIFTLCAEQTDPHPNEQAFLPKGSIIRAASSTLRGPTR